MIAAMGDWEQFVGQVSWFLAPGESADVKESEPWSRSGIDGLPRLSALLRTASVTPVSVNGRDYELMAWGPQDSRRGWLCRPPASDIGVRVHSVHEPLLAVCGGIVEQFGEPVSWWNNQNEVLTASAAGLPLASLLADYMWIWQDHGLEVPIDPDDFYAVAVEANGNLTFAHRLTGRIVVFAPDHAFDGVTPLPGSPPYSLMTIDAVPDLAAWIELCAEAWSEGGTP